MEPEFPKGVLGVCRVPRGPPDAGSYDPATYCESFSLQDDTAARNTKQMPSQWLRHSEKRQKHHASVLTAHRPRTSQKQKGLVPAVLIRPHRLRLKIESQGYASIASETLSLLAPSRDP